MTTYGGSRFRAIADGRSAAQDRQRACCAPTVKPGAPVTYLAHYSMNLSTDAQRAALSRARSAATMDRLLMRVLLVYCHPVPDSFCAAIRDVAIEVLTGRGDEVRLIDLYAERLRSGDGLRGAPQLQ